MKKKHTNHTLKKAISLTVATTVLCTGIFTPDFFSTQSVTVKTTSQKTITVTDNSSTTTTLGTNITQFIDKAVDTNTTNTTTNVTAKSTTINIQDTMPTTDTTTTEAPASTPAATKKPTSTKTPATTKKPAATKKPVAAKKPQKKKSNITKITISAAGDCTLGSDYKSPSGVNFYAKYNEKKDPSYFFKNVKSIFKKDNLTLVNFEGTLTKRNTRADKTFAFKGNPSYLKILQKGNVDAVSFANNHCRDYGEGSYNDTIAVFKKNKMPFASYGKVSVYKTKGKKIGMIAVNGLDGVSSSERFINSGIKKLKKKKADLIVVSMHAGIEKTSVINDVQKTIAHYAVKKGANLVLGHHPHTLQGIEKYKGAYIVYSLANFCFGGNTNPADKDTMIFQQTFTFKNKKLKKTKDVKIIPCKVSSSNSINNYQPTPAKGAAKKRIIAKMNRFCKPYNLKFKNNGKLR